MCSKNSIHVIVNMYRYIVAGFIISLFELAWHVMLGIICIGGSVDSLSDTRESKRKTKITLMHIII